ncbi:MAG: hypothetical protein QM658_15565, partial [Gordonia sp. (in: high G+C Gram-positive bacteria)]
MTEFTDSTVAFGQTAFLTDEDADPRLPEAAYWRVTLPGDALPAGPLLVYRFGAEEFAPYDIALGRTEVTPEAPLLIAVPPCPDRFEVASLTAWVEVEMSAGSEVRVAVVRSGVGAVAPNGMPIEVAARNTAPYVLAATDISAVRITGSGHVEHVTAYCLPNAVRVEDLQFPGLVDKTCFP